MFKAFKKIFKRIFKAKPSVAYNKLLEDIASGELLEINGKQYRKIQITFVDSMNYRVFDYVENLETEIKFINEQLIKANSELQKLNNQYTALQNYNKLLIHKDAYNANAVARAEKYISENLNLSKRIAEMERNRNLGLKKITDLQYRLNQSQEINDHLGQGDNNNFAGKITTLLNENLKLRRAQSVKDETIRDLVGKIALMQVKINKLLSTRKEKKRKPPHDDLDDL